MAARQSCHDARPGFLARLFRINDLSLQLLNISLIALLMALIDMMGSRAPPADEREPLLGDASASQCALTGATNHEDEHNQATDKAVPTGIARRLYVSHFLSTWNSRVFEFGATLYLATIFPHTLLPLSIYALIRGLSAVVFSPAVGQYIDKSDRLQCVRLSISTVL
jgi:hypothetical protein